MSSCHIERDKFAENKRIFAELPVSLWTLQKEKKILLNFRDF